MFVVGILGLSGFRFNEKLWKLFQNEFEEKEIFQLKRWRKKIARIFQKKRSLKIKQNKKN